MNSQKDPFEPPGSKKRNRVPRAAIIVDTVIAIVLCGTGLYHFTQPHQAWRSGATEVACAALLITAAYFVDWIKAMTIHVAVAVIIFGLGVRHLLHWVGWRSGSTELLLAIILLVVAGTIYRHRHGKG